MVFQLCGINVLVSNNEMVDISYCQICYINQIKFIVDENWKEGVG